MAQNKTRKPRGNPTLRIAFIGAGGIASAHLDALKRIDEARVVALADIDRKALADKAEKYDLDQACLFTDYRKMLRTVRPGAVIVCTPNGLHKPASIASSRAGAHVLVEKPLAMNAAQGKAMLDAAREARRKLVIGFQYRFEPRTKFIKQAVDAGKMGRIMFARVQAIRRRGIPNWGVFGRKDLQGGGPLIDIGVHVLEMCHYTMGSPRPVAAVGNTWTYLGNKPSGGTASMWPGWDHKTYDVEDLAVGHIHFDNGAVIHIEAMFAGHVDRNVFDFQLMGDKGGAAWSDPRLFRDEDGHMVNITPGWLASAKEHNGLFHAKLRDFVDHVLYNKPSMAPGEHGLMVQKMLDGVYRSAGRGGKEVAIR
jgi:predicted dehydrogenase